MTLEDPKAIQAGFSKIMERLMQATAPMSAQGQRSLATELTSAFNYLSRTVLDTNGFNLLYGLAATQKKTNDMLEADHSRLKAHQEFVRTNFQAADAYLKTIQLAGYAIFFAIWALSKDWITPWGGVLACLLMVVSAAVFLAWEVYKSSLLTAILRRHAGIALAKREERLLKHIKTPTQDVALLQLARWRTFVWWCSLIPALAAVSLLGAAFLRMLGAQLA